MVLLTCGFVNITPFKVVGYDLIKHFSPQEHKDGHVWDEKICREACFLPIYSYPFYRCVQCHFVLHKICDKFMIKNHTVLSMKQLNLHSNDMSFLDIFKWGACRGWIFLKFGAVVLMKVIPYIPLHLMVDLAKVAASIHAMSNARTRDYKLGH